MNQKLIVEIGKSQRLQIIIQLKRTQGLTVGELANRLKMSYMGIKQHCIELSGKGYLDTMRRAKQIGRPEMVYRLTERARELFPVASNETTLALLEAAQKLYGVSASEKLLLLIFQKKEARYRSKMRGETPAERMKSLVKLRDAEGHMADFESDENGARIAEHHSPIADLAQAYPLIARLETELFQRLLGTEIVRTETRISGLYSCIFLAPQLASKTAEENQSSPEEAFTEPVSELSEESLANDEVVEIAFGSDEKMAVSDEEFLSENETNSMISKTENPPNTENEIAHFESANDEVVEPQFVRDEIAEFPAEPLIEPISAESANHHLPEMEQTEEPSSPLAAVENESLEIENAPMENAPDFLPTEEAISRTTNPEIESEKNEVEQEESATVSSEISEVKEPEEPPRIGIRKLPKVQPKPLVRRKKMLEEQTPDLFSL